MFDLFIRDAVFRTDCIVILLLSLIWAIVLLNQTRRWRTYRRALSAFDRKLSALKHKRDFYRHFPERLTDAIRISTLTESVQDIAALSDAQENEIARLKTLVAILLGFIVFFLFFLVTCKSYSFLT